MISLNLTAVSQKVEDVCRITSRADLEMAVCDLSWPYSVRMPAAGSWASQARVCVSVCLNLVWEFHHSALTSFRCYQSALHPVNQNSPSTSQNVPRSASPLFSFVTLMEHFGDRWTVTHASCWLSWLLGRVLSVSAAGALERLMVRERCGVKSRYAAEG